MPQASEYLRERMRVRFGDLDVHGPQSFLLNQGWTITRAYNFVKPAPDHRPEDLEWECVDFLIEEWDYGGVTAV